MKIYTLGIIFIIVTGLTIGGFILFTNFQDRNINLEQKINEGYGNYFLVLAGKFLMGDNHNEGNPRERPVHIVYVDTYYIGEYEVTNEEFHKFIEDSGYEKEKYWSKGGFGFYDEPLYWNDEDYNGGGIRGN